MYPLNVLSDYMDTRSFLYFILIQYWDHCRSHPDSFSLQKLSGRFQLRTQSLLLNHIIKSLLESRHSGINNNHCLLLENLTPKQWLKGTIVDANNRLNGILPSFDPFSSEISPGTRLIDIFLSQFSFHCMDRKYKEERRAHICKLDETTL